MAALALDHGQRIGAARLADLLWPDERPSTWEASLRVAIKKVRDFLAAGGLDRDTALVTERRGYRLQLPEDATVDVLVAELAVDAAESALARGAVDDARPLASKARITLSAPFLPGVELPWVADERQRLRVLHARVLEVLGTCRLEEGQHAAAASVLEEALAIEPFRESTWRALMDVHADAGNAAEGLRAYERCRRLLADELGVDPAPETRARHEALLAATDATVAETERTAPAVHGADISIDQPYLGLRAFQQHDAALFHGREPEVQLLLDRLASHGLAVVVGSSGTGKSSLVRAGLLPALGRGGIADSDLWRTAVCVPGADAPAALAAALNGLSGDREVRRATARLGVDEGALSEAASQLLSDDPPGACLLVVVDQFEELFTQTQDAGERACFVRTLVASTRDPYSGVRVVLVLRADFVPHAADHPELAEALTRQPLVVGPLDGDGLQRAIEQPARLAGALLEEGLAGRIVADVAGQPAPLPAMQHALLELWQRRTGNVLTRGAYEDIGGVSGALSRRAEQVFASLSVEHQDLARHALLRMTQPGEGTEDVRRRVRWNELAGIADQAAVRAVIDALAAARLVTTSSDPDGERTVEVAHEALINAWPRLRGWIDADREMLAVQRRVTAAAELWREHGQDPAYLFTGGRLDEALAWLGSTAHPTPLEAAFVEAAVARREQERARRRTVRMIALGAVLVAVIGLAVLGVLASVQRERAEEQAQLARSRAVAAAADLVVEQDAELALLLALEAWELAPEAEAQRALRGALASSYLRQRLPVEGEALDAVFAPDGRTVVSTSSVGGVSVHAVATGDLVASEPLPGGREIAFAPDGERFLVAYDDGTARVHAAADARVLHVLDHGVVGPVHAAWTSDGQEIAVGGLDSAVSVWDAASGERLRTVQPAEGVDTTGFSGVAMAVSLDGRTVIRGHNRHQMVVYDLRTGAERFRTRNSFRAAISPDGRFLFAGGSDPGITDNAVPYTPPLEFAALWSLETDELLTVFDTSLPDGALVSARSLAFSPDGGYLAIGLGGGGTTLLVDLERAEVIRRLQGPDGEVSSVAFTADGRHLVVPGAVLDVESGEIVARLTPGPASATVAADPSGDAIVVAASDVLVFDAPSTPRVVGAVGAPAHAALAVDDGALLVGIHLDRSVVGWDAATGAERWRLRYGNDIVEGIGTDPRGRWVTVAPATPEGAVGVLVIDVEDGTGRFLPIPPGSDPHDRCRGGTCEVVHAPVHGDGRILGVGRGGVLVVWRADGTVDRQVSIGDVGLQSGTWVGEDQAVVQDTTGSAHLVDLVSGGVVRTFGEDLAAPPLPTTGPAVTQDGRLVTAHGDDQPRVWDLGTGALLRELRGSGRAVNPHVHASGRFVAFGGTPVVFDLASGARVTDLPPVAVPTARFVGTGLDIVAGGLDGRIRMWTCRLCVAADELVELARARVTRELTDVERTTYLAA